MSQIVSKSISLNPEPVQEPVQEPAEGVPTRQRRRRGILIRIVENKGYGFIRPEGGGIEYFAHINSMRNRSDWELCRQAIEDGEGLAVTFRAKTGKVKGSRAPAALHIVLVKEK